MIYDNSNFWLKKGMTTHYCGDEYVSTEQVKWGSHKDPRGILFPELYYIVKDVEIHTSHTRIYLEGIEGYFNSVWFEDQEKVLADMKAVEDALNSTERSK